MMDFENFRNLVNTQFSKMCDNHHNLFVVDVPKEWLWETYITSFPDGTNPMFRSRTYYDCNTCRHFVQRAGGIVYITQSNDLVSIWDVHPQDHGFQVVTNTLSELVKSAPIAHEFMTSEKEIGKRVTYAFEPNESKVKESWNHFHITVPDKFVFDKEDIGSKLARNRSNFQVLNRGLKEITMDAIEVVLDLISQNSIYRGTEFWGMVSDHYNLKKEYDKVEGDAHKLNFVWNHVSYAPIRNTVIGTLLTDISDGVPLDEAVGSFEKKVAPENYMRPTPVVTKKMIEDAQKTVNSMGLLSSLNRRHAVIEDINVSDVLFTDRGNKTPAMENVFDELSKSVKVTVPTSNRIITMPIEEFIKNVIPTATSVEVFMEGKHTQHLMNITTAEDATCKHLFKWNNNFAWSYNGGMADSIKTRVKNAGGNVTGDVRISLGWFNTDDLDLHVVEPNGHEIYFGDKRAIYTGGSLDVDMNVSGERTDPVENIVYPSRTKMKEGIYLIIVNQYNKRNTSDYGFEVEIETNGQLKKYSFGKMSRTYENVPVAQLIVDKDHNITIKDILSSTPISKDIWGITTETFIPVNYIMKSPNHWGNNAVGNLHYFFILNGCKNPDITRGFFNEQLKSDLTEHRKVFELLGDKMSILPTDNQLAGVGFSSTSPNSLTCRVVGKYNRLINVTF